MPSPRLTQNTAISGYLRMFRAQKRAQGNIGVDRTPLEPSQRNEVANTPGFSNTRQPSL
jgi:hypothetical protein